MHECPIELSFLNVCFGNSLQTYLWDDNTLVTDWLETQLEGDSMKPDSLLSENIRCLKRDHALLQVRQILEASLKIVGHCGCIERVEEQLVLVVTQVHPEVATDSMVHAFQHMNASQKADLLRALNNLGRQEEEPPKEEEPAEVAAGPAGDAAETLPA